ncbi:hypothetical protein [Kitasatospora sp. NPDC098663]|uniref:hypothetical protein n=1 Tax=Kitasatospora sp. NPDC098663 TaxID=3364096 RepID=UPI0038015483
MSTCTSDIIRRLASAQLLTTASIISTASAASLCATLHEWLLTENLVLTCGSQIWVQAKLRGVRRAALAARSTGQISHQHDSSN